MKIVPAVNAMIANPKAITSVMPGREGNEIFFLFMDKYKWSISKANDSGHNLFYYAMDTPLETLASWDDDVWHRVNEFVKYSSKEIGSREAIESFAELYRIVKEREYGIDDVLDDIIANADWN